MTLVWVSSLNYRRFYLISATSLISFLVENICQTPDKVFHPLFPNASNLVTTLFVSFLVSSLFWCFEIVFNTVSPVWHTLKDCRHQSNISRASRYHITKRGFASVYQSNFSLLLSNPGYLQPFLLSGPQKFEMHDSYINTIL